MRHQGGTDVICMIQRRETCLIEVWSECCIVSLNANAPSYQTFFLEFCEVLITLYKYNGVSYGRSFLFSELISLFKLMAPGSLDFISWFYQFLSNQMYISISDHSFFNFYSLTDSGFRSKPMNWSDLGMAQWKLFLKLTKLLQGKNRSLILIYIWLETNWLKEIKSRLPGAINLKRRLILKTGRTFHMILHCIRLSFGIRNRVREIVRDTPFPIKCISVLVICLFLAAISSILKLISIKMSNQKTTTK